VAYSVRAAAWASALTTVVIAGVGLAFVQRWLDSPIPLDEYLHQPASWVTLIVVILVSASVILRALAAYLRASAQLVHRLREQRDEIERLALHDHLTGLPQASLAGDRLEVALHAARRSGGTVAVLYIDLDGFKQVNDSLGHDAGDVVLRSCAERLRSVLRKEDTVARLGGDEFLVVVTLRKPEEAETVADKLLKAMEPLVEVGEYQARVGASIGIACHPEHGHDGHTLRRHADAAMYQAKRLGRHRYAWAWKPGSPRDAAQMPAYRPTAVDAD
jgi:diguanylate cyclase (GGDEF)-like protein